MPDRSDPAARVIRRDPVGMLTLRGDLTSEPLVRAVREVTGGTMPETRRISFVGENAIAWMSPDELMLFLPPAYVAEAARQLIDALAGQHHLVTDVSDARVLFRIEGPGAREVLAKGAPVDLAPAAFGPGDFRRTRLGQVAAAVWAVEAEVFEVMCFRSVAGFVAAWLETAAEPGSLPGFFAPGR